MKILKMLAVFALASCAALVRADPPSQVGRLNFISGPVSFAPAEADNDWALATLNRPITTGDRLWADRDAGAEMHVGSTVIRMTGLTSVDVLNIDDRNIQLGLADGSVNVRLRNSPSDKLFEVDTPHGAVILNQPGSYRVSVDPSGAETTVTVRSGQAEVFTGASSFPVDANERARITGTDFLSYDIVAAPPMDEFDRWAAARDRKEDRIASTRYVSPEMTGYEDLDEYGSWRVVGDYGSVWVPAAVPVGWAPYRYGHWVWISPWGWTWVDSAPWGFAPFHYGRWVWVGRYWAWAPGPVAVRPVYAPALVAFVGGSNWSVSAGIGSAPVVGWVPLGWREPFIPWYRVSPTYVRNVNVAHVTNVNVTNIYNNTTVTNVRHANRNAPSGVTVVRREHFVSAKPVEPVKISSQALATAPVTSAAPVHTPQSASFATSRPGPRPPARVLAREVVAVNAPPVPMRDDRAHATTGDRGPAFARSSGERPRVRVIGAQRDAVRQSTTQVEPRPQRAERENGRVTPSETLPPQVQTPVQRERPVPASPPEVSGRPTFDRDMRANTPRPAAPPAAGGPRPAQQTERQSVRERAAEDAPPRAQPQPPQARRAAAPPPEVSRRPTFDREMRQVAPQAGKPPAAEARREQRREQASGQSNNTPQAQSAPQPDIRATPRPAPEQRTQQQDRQRQQQAQEQQAREQQARQREMQQREEERQRAQQQRAEQQAQEQQAREQQARQREMQQREEERQRAQQQRAQQQAQEQQAREQRAQQQRAQQQAQEQQAREQRAQQQRAQQQAQEQQAREQQARQREAQQQQEQRLRENAEKHAPQASLAAERRPQPQRAEQARGKGPDRQRAEKSD